MKIIKPPRRIVSTTCIGLLLLGGLDVFSASIALELYHVTSIHFVIFLRNPWTVWDS